MANSIKTEEIGKLGFGYMRLPKINGELDVEQTNKMADTFLSNGGTYFDVAYVYDGAEVALRETVIKRHPRDSFQVASKLPVSMVSKDKPMEHFLNTSLERIGTDYLDFYLLHGIDARGNKLCEDLGAWEYLAKLKDQGIIRHMGFSFHGPADDLDEILTKHPETEFTQLQINYWDWDNPNVNGRRLYEIATKHNVPIIIMEPLLGGKLASKDSPIAELLHNANPKATIASWALRFIAQLDGVFTTLSGMSTFEQLVDNLETYADFKPLNKSELETIDKAVEILKSVPRIQCTECDYCKDCPVNVPIPGLLNLYNSHLVHKTTTNLDGTYNWITNGKAKANECIACGVCEEICPQRLEIVELLGKISALFD